MNKRAMLFAAVSLSVGLAASADDKLVDGHAPDLAPPVRLLASDKPIDANIGHAAPFYADIDGDGVRDLLVGQFDGGQLRIYHNFGTNAQPAFRDMQWFKAGADLGKVPYG